MKGFFRSKLFLSLAALVMVLLLTVTISQTSRVHAASSEQVIFSGVGASVFTMIPVGFWIWCEAADSTNPYHGKCNGAMYFYTLHITKHVDGVITENSNGTYFMDVQSSDGSVICSLANASPPTSGPTNTVNIRCGPPFSFGFGVSTNAVVNVTGP